MIHSVLASYDDQFCHDILGKLMAETRKRLDTLVATTAGSEGESSAPECSILQDLKLDPGRLSLETIRDELAKLERLRACSLPADLFRGISPHILETYQQRAVAEESYEIRRHPEALRFTLLASFCWTRQQEIIDALVELVIGTVHHIKTHAENRVTKSVIADIRRVSGKTELLFKLSEAALAQPDGIVHQVLYPVIGEDTLRDIVKEHQATGLAFQQKLYAAMRGSYRSHYRQGLAAILKALAFQANPKTDQPLLDALKLLQRYADMLSHQAYFAQDEAVPLENIVPEMWREWVVQSDPEGMTQIKRIDYEISVLHALREKLRCKEVWIEGAKRFRNPDEDLPADFTKRRAEYYAALQQPLDASLFVSQLKKKLRAALEALDRDLPINPHVKITDRENGWIMLSPFEAQTEQMHLERLTKKKMFKGISPPHFHYTHLSQSMKLWKLLVFSISMRSNPFF